MILTDKRLPVALNLVAALVCIAFAAIPMAIGCVIGAALSPLIARWLR